MTGRLDDLNLVITGGTGALGRAVAARLLAEGAVCHLPDIEAAGLSGFPLAHNPRIKLSYEVDLTKEADVERFYATVPVLWASIHLAGGFAMGKITEASADVFERMMAINARTAWLCTRAAAKAMLAGGRGGRIVNVGARPALEPRSGASMAAYAASKAAVAALTVAVAEEMKMHDILVNAIAPSVLDTPANRSAMPGIDPSLWLAPDAAAEAILFLVSPRNRATSGAVLPLYAKA